MNTINQIPGGVCAPQGFKASGMHCGITKKVEKKDIGLIFSTVPCVSAAVYTKNKVKAAPLKVTREHLENGTAQAILCNSGNANACNADGYDVASKMCQIASAFLGIPESEIVVASTGVIGQPLNIHPVDACMKSLVGYLSENGSGEAADAIMTTDLMKKEIAVSFTLGGKECKIGAIAKGSGMIHPNMGTMLSFITTDADITAPMLSKALKMVVEDTFNMVSVDGDTSTNDMAVVLANGLAGNAKIEAQEDDFDTFVIALMYVCIYLARMMAKDGEGATKLLECSVKGAKTEESARILAKSVITSSLFKTAMFGADANWGRVLCALGYAETDFDPAKAEVSFASKAGEILVCRDGCGVAFSESRAKEILLHDEIEVHVDLHQGPGEAVAWGCDLTYDYVKINGDYRS
ncbi:MAG: bifunctional ornithine acetyltransferase/N-acetylglutamate synthase [Oscillospiraceae bacterium]|jgi:glutamate N-acetyltransferase/amino-acid N-acetyltransferase|nr:bifunctional ornithine acetyltransferase/N-acetylglutamate synthase [Oscillospiraceae bacterium]